ncbi:MAG: DNA repair protein RecN [Bacteroidetes bacterium]|nr:DNA repair protein RecN [Bacteroidota bacterium]
MLKNLLIENYALIEKLDIGFSKGFSVITGETGAGKSIMFGALSLILGTRADSQVLKDKLKKCIIEGSFEISSYQLENFFEHHELDYEHECMLRREISPAGKSRAFINDTPVNLTILKALGDRLVNIHSQHAIITLNDANFQLAVLDNYIGLDNEITSYRKQFNKLRLMKKELVELIEIEEKSKIDLDYFQFQFDELEKANLLPDEQNLMEAELALLTHSEEIKTAVLSAYQTIGVSDGNILGQLAALKNSLDRVSSFHPNLSSLLARLESNVIELNDINSDLQAIDDSVTHDPNRIEELNSRLDLVYDLQQKHRVQTINDLIEIKEALNEKLNSIGSIDDKIEKLKAKIDLEINEVSESASQISNSRTAAIPSIETKIVKLLHELGMPNARFAIDNQVQTELGPDGFDKVRYLFNANKGGNLSEVAKIASGGELSRLMLSIKSMISGKKLLPTIIFDEIDNGVSGEIAAKVGTILTNMSDTIQVIVITHLPQIAGKGNHHYKVSKETDHLATRSEISLLNEDERVIEIAKMISGVKVSDVAIENARILLS